MTDALPAAHAPDGVVIAIKPTTQRPEVRSWAEMMMMKSVSVLRLCSLVGTAFLAVATFAGRAEAGSIEFVYNCSYVGATTCTPGGPFGTITLTDSLTDINRVDIDVSINGASIAATGLNNFFLNYGGSVPDNYKFVLVNQGDPAGTWQSNAGKADVGFDNRGPFGGTLDMKLDPDGSCPTCLTFSGSLLLFLDTNPHTEANLDVSMFNLRDANNLLYSAFDTMPANGQSPKYGATIVNEVPTAVPEPASMLLLGSGLIGLARFGKRIRAQRN